MCIKRIIGGYFPAICRLCFNLLSFSTLSSATQLVTSYNLESNENRAEFDLIVQFWPL